MVKVQSSKFKTAQRGNTQRTRDPGNSHRPPHRSATRSEPKAPAARKLPPPGHAREAPDPRTRQQHGKRRRLITPLMRDDATARFDGPWPTHRNTHASRRTHPPLSPGAKPACPFGGARQSPRASGIPIPVPTTRAPASRSRYFTEAYRPAGLNMPPLPTRAHAAGQAPPHSTPTAWHATPRHTAVLKLARSAPGSCSRLGSVPIRSARPGPVWVRTATPLPACWVPCQPASPLSITTFANPASPGLALHRHPLTTASCCCRCTRTLSLAKTGGLGGRLRECVRLIRAQEPGCHAVDVCVADPCLLAARLVGCPAQSPTPYPGAAARCSRLPPDPRPPPRPPLRIRTGRWPARPLHLRLPSAFLTGAPGCPLPACCLYDKPACNHLV